MNKEIVLEFVTNEILTLTETETIRPDDELFEDLSLSSMDRLFLYSKLEIAYNIKFTEKLVRKVYTVQDLVDLVLKLSA